MARACEKLSAVLVAVGLAGLPVPAAAAPPEEASEPPSATSSRDTVALEPLEIEGKLQPHLQENLRARIIEGLGRGELGVVEQGEGSTFVLHAKIKFQKPDYLIGLVLRQPGVEEPIATAERTCDLCGAQELEELAADLAATVARTASARVELETKLLVSSQPSGAEVTVDGQPVGVTPLELDVEPGDHEVGVRMEGYRSRTHQLGFDEGERESLSVTLEPEGPDKLSRTYRVLGWTGVGAGIAGIGAGVALIVINDQPITSDCSGVNQDADGDCKFVHRTLPGGIALAGVGAALLGTGIAFLVLERKRAKERNVQALIGPRMIGLRGRF